jgi:uncharacterized protein (TIGR03435 family)
MKPIALSLFACAAWAQQALPPVFEVASVKVAEPFTPGIGRGPGVMRGCGKPDPAMVHCNGVTLKTLVMRAYDVKTYQVQGPDWIGTESYDVMAKVPEGVPADKVPAMLQALLAERFGVKLHKETRILPAYELGVAKGGPKLKEIDTAKLPGMPEPGAGPSPPEGRRGPPSVSSMPAGAMMIMFNSNGARTFRGNMTMAQLTNYFTNSLDRPVFDNTGLKGTYEIELSYLADGTDGMGLGMAGGPGPEPGPAAAATGGRGDAAGPQDANAPIATLFQAVQQTLGLKLDPKKAPVDMIVVDSANKVPTDN